MPCLEKYLTNQFWRGLDLPGNAMWKVWDTSTSGPSRGKWVRPDFTSISVLPLQVLPAPQLDVYSFELKPERSGDEAAVHEALTQTRTTNFGHLVWHLSRDSPLEWRLAGVREECVRHGIGLILIREPQNIDTWEILIDPLRRLIVPSDIDAFLASRLSEAERHELRARMKGNAS